MATSLDWYGCATFALRTAGLTVFLDAYIDRAPDAESRRLLLAAAGVVLATSVASATGAALAGRGLTGLAVTLGLLLVVVVAKSPRIDPGIASSTLVAPINVRTNCHVLSSGPSTTMATTGPLVMKSSRSS